MFGNACTWLANLANASCHNWIWYPTYQLIASWCPYKKITWYKQHYMCTALAHACSVLPECYGFQSFTILHELNTLHPQLLKILKLSCMKHMEIQEIQGKIQVFQWFQEIRSKWPTLYLWGLSMSMVQSWRTAWVEDIPRLPEDLISL